MLGNLPLLAGDIEHNLSGSSSASEWKRVFQFPTSILSFTVDITLMGVHVLQHPSLTFKAFSCQGRSGPVVLGCDCLVFGKGWLHTTHLGSGLPYARIRGNILVTTLIGLKLLKKSVVVPGRLLETAHGLLRVGGNKKKFFTLNGFEEESLLAIYNWMHPFSNTSETIHCGGVLCSKAFLHECRYAVGDYVVFEDQLSQPNRSEEIIRRGHLKKLFLHEQEGEIQLFMNVEALLQRDFNMDEVTGMPLIHRRQPGCVPPWPEPGDLILASYTDSEMREAFVVEVDDDNRKVLLFWAHDHHANALWLDWKLIVSVLPSSSIEVARDEDLNSQQG
ncbi:hypothetical protein GOP47_0012876 [Adiantum capillus-veneris]|uniref:Uncharacterized protein n=1 Tax=Adiantum capillus-veneris TaxID=13818 RepID=A0A9D4URX0_ADICA|nr:hypothetical protein GOP47_0012876 [Adiantum capillus-veneris]